MLQTYLKLIIFFSFTLNVCSQNISAQKISGVNVVTIRNQSGIVSQIPQSYPGNYQRQSSGNFSSSTNGTLEKDNYVLFSWVLKFTASNRVFKDISFANTQVGYIVTELGAVYKSTNGGENWLPVMNLGFPYYWYGVHALSPDTVVISGFNNQGPIGTGVVRWTLNGGSTWTNDIILRRQGAGVGWLERIRFFDRNTGIVFNTFSGACYYTSTGGKDTTAWTFVQVNSDLGWFAGNIDAQSSGLVYATGIHLAKSTNFGVNWTSGPSADNVFDGGVDFLDYNNLFGWTGGGQISSPVSGWTHRTTDGGSTWGSRQYTFPYPVRSVYFFNQNTGFAIGGNLYQEAGGIYSTSDGGTNWNLDISTSAEMFSLDYKLLSADSMDLWCAGSTGSSTGFTGKLYKARIQNMVGVNIINSEIPGEFLLCQNYPNPFNPVTKIRFKLPASPLGKRLQPLVRLDVFDVLGREIILLVNRQLSSGTYEITFDGTGLPSGIYFYRLQAGDHSDVRKMILLK